MFGYRVDDAAKEMSRFLIYMRKFPKKVGLGHWLPFAAIMMLT